ncbi:MAG: hypothetical protein LM561_04045 [Desulfurococcaceae archaeon]|jgi:hypothetical protein|nr:hypothetical protein [Desulfurococcaceae archaeon]
MLELYLMTATLLLVLISITGYDKYVAAKIRGRLRREQGVSEVRSNLGGYEVDTFTKMKVKKVKASKIGSYLIITLLVSEGEESGRGEVVEIDNPVLLTYLEDEEDVTT